MDIKNIIQASAKIIKITELSVGNVVKFVEESSYSSAQVKFAVVSDLLNDGDKTFVELLVYSQDYSDGVKLEKKLLSGGLGDNKVALFPATKSDLLTSFQELKDSVNKKIEDKSNELLKLKANFKLLTEMVEKNDGAELSTPKFQELE